MTQEALKLALEALEGFYEYGYDRQECFEHITAIKEALAQPEQEPVADDFFRMIADRNPKPFPPPQRTWQGLTDVEMEATFIECGGKWNGDFWKIEDADFHPFLRTIEAKLKELNG